MLYREGMTDRRLASKVAAKYVGVSDSTWRAYITRGQAPGPDGHDDGFDMDYWLESTLDGWKASRPGHGGRPKSGAPAAAPDDTGLGRRLPQPPATGEPTR